MTKENLVESETLSPHYELIISLIDSQDCSSKEFVRYAFLEDPKINSVDEEIIKEYEDQINEFIGSNLVNQLYPEILQNPQNFRMGDMIVMIDVEDAINNIAMSIKEYRHKGD